MLHGNLSGSLFVEHTEMNNVSTGGMTKNSRKIGKGSLSERLCSFFGKHKQPQQPWRQQAQWRHCQAKLVQCLKQIPSATRNLRNRSCYSHSILIDTLLIFCKMPISITLLISSLSCWVFICASSLVCTIDMTNSTLRQANECNRCKRNSDRFFPSGLREKERPLKEEGVYPHSRVKYARIEWVFCHLASWIKAVGNWSGWKRLGVNALDCFMAPNIHNSWQLTVFDGPCGCSGWTGGPTFSAPL